MRRLLWLAASECLDQAIPYITAGSCDVIIAAETGSGKTLCYLLPTLREHLGEPGASPSLCILVPTQELVSSPDDAK